jgi:hypothetical protein
LNCYRALCVTQHVISLSVVNIFLYQILLSI